MCWFAAGPGLLSSWAWRSCGSAVCKPASWLTLYSVVAVLMIHLYTLRKLMSLDFQLLGKLFSPASPACIQPCIP